MKTSESLSELPHTASGLLRAATLAAIDRAYGYPVDAANEAVGFELLISDGDDDHTMVIIDKSIPKRRRVWDILLGLTPESDVRIHFQHFHDDEPGPAEMYSVAPGNDLVRRSAWDSDGAQTADDEACLPAQLDDALNSLSRACYMGEQ